MVAYPVGGLDAFDERVIASARMDAGWFAAMLGLPELFTYRSRARSA